jgi:hypothetical protein
MTSLSLRSPTKAITAASREKSVAVRNAAW